MIYRIVRAIVGFALRLFYRIRLSAPIATGEGPLILVGNHPNALMDPALIFVLADRQVTFLAKAPIFKMPVIGWIARNMGALPVYRKQDDPAQMGRNEGTFDAAIAALERNGAITLFPEGMSHDLPRLAELKTGAARIALRAVAAGAPVRIIPVGLNYAQKHLFHSEVRVEPGAPIEVSTYAHPDSEQDADSVRQLTEAIAHGLETVTLNLEQWEDLPLIETAEELYAIHHDEPKRDPERRRRFARGLRLFRSEQPERYAAIQDELMSFRQRLTVTRAALQDLAIDYRKRDVARFIVKNLAVLGLGLPVFALGLALFWLPYQIPRWATRASKETLDTQATVKFLTAIVVTFSWWAMLVAVGAWFAGLTGAAVTLFAALPLALFTLYMGMRIRSVISDVRVFFTLGHRESLKRRLREQASRLTEEISRIVDELGPRVAA